MQNYIYFPTTQLEANISQFQPIIDVVILWMNTVEQTIYLFDPNSELSLQMVIISAILMPVLEANISQFLHVPIIDVVMSLDEYNRPNHMF